MRIARSHSVDKNQAAIVAALRANGITVKDCSAVGNGFPDLACASFGGNYLIEVKSGKSEPLTAAQKLFHENWNGDIGIVYNAEQALEWVILQARREGRL